MQPLAPHPAGPTAPAAPSSAAAGRWTVLRFVAAGSAGNAVYALVFLAAAQLGAPTVVLNLLASVVSTLLVNEAHRLWTFAAHGRPSVVQAHAAGAASAVLGLCTTSIALSAWTWVDPDAGNLSSIVVAWTVTGLVGTGNYLVLRRAAGPARDDATPGAERATGIEPA